MRKKSSKIEKYGNGIKVYPMKDGRYCAVLPYRDLMGDSKRLRLTGNSESAVLDRLAAEIEKLNIVNGRQQVTPDVELPVDATLHDLLLAAAETKFRLNIPGNNKKPLSSRTLDNYLLICRQVDALAGDSPVSALNVETVSIIFKIFQRGDEGANIEPRSESYLNKLYYVMKFVLSLAVESGILNTNPLSGEIGRYLKPHSILDSTPIKAYSADEVYRIFRSLKRQSVDWETLSENERYIRPVHDFYLFFTLLIYTGLRSEEARALTWGDIDYKTGIVKVRKAITLDFDIEGMQSKHSRAVESKTKNSSSIRDVKVGVDVLELFKKYETYCTKRGLSCDSRDYIFRSWKFKKLYTGNGLQTSINKFLDFDGCDVHFRPHRLRHNAGTVMENMGASDHSMMVQLGISQAKTLRTYTDRGPGIVKNNGDLIAAGVAKEYGITA